MSMNPDDFVDKTPRRIGAMEAALIQHYEEHRGSPLNVSERLDLLRYIDDAVHAENPTNQQQLVLRVTKYRQIANKIAQELTPGQLKQFANDIRDHRLQPRSLDRVQGLDMFGLGPPADSPMYSRMSRPQIDAYNRGTSFLPEDAGGMSLAPPDLRAQAAAVSDMADMGMGPDPAMNFEDYGPGYSGLDDERLPGSQFERQADRPVTGAEAKAARATLNRKLAEAGLPLEGDGPVTTRMADPNYRSPRSPGLRMNNVVKGQGDLPPAPPGLLSTLVQPLEGQRPGSMTQGSILNSWRDIIDQVHDPRSEPSNPLANPNINNSLKAELRLRPDDARAQMQAKNAAFSSPNAMPFPPDAPLPARGPLPDYPESATGIPGTAQDFGVQQRAQGQQQGRTLAYLEAVADRLRTDPSASVDQIRAAEDRVQQVATLMARGVDEENIREFFTTVTGQDQFRGNTPENQWLRPDSPSYGGTPPLDAGPEGLRASQLYQNVDPEAGAESYSGWLGSRPPQDTTRVSSKSLGLPRPPEWAAYDAYMEGTPASENLPMPSNLQDFDRVEGAPPPVRVESSLENPWDPGGVGFLDPDSGLPLREVDPLEQGIRIPRTGEDTRFDMEGRGSGGGRPLSGSGMGGEGYPVRPDPNAALAVGGGRDAEARLAAIVARQPAGVGVPPAQPTGLPLDMSSPGPSLAAPRGGAPSMTGAPDMTDLFSRLSQRLGKALPAINTGMTALGVGGNLLDLYGMNDFNKYITEQNAQGGVPSSSGTRVPVDPMLATGYSGLGMAIPFLGSMMFNRNTFMDDPAYRDRFLYGDNPPVPA